MALAFKMMLTLFCFCSDQNKTKSCCVFDVSCLFASPGELHKKWGKSNWMLCANGLKT